MKYIITKEVEADNVNEAIEKEKKCPVLHIETESTITGIPMAGCSGTLGGTRSIRAIQ